MKRGKFFLAVVVALSLFVAAPQAMAKTDVLFGGAAIVGVYYQVALQISNMMNRLMGDKYNYVGRPTGGSVFNINSMIRETFEFGVAQSDRNFQAYNGVADWEGKPVSNLRSVFSMHPETVMLVTRKDTGITKVEDIKGKRVNIGNPGSGQRFNAEEVMRIYGIDQNRDIMAEGLQQTEASRALIDRKIDAFFYTVGNPSAALEEPAQSIDMVMIPLDHPDIQKLAEEHPYYVYTKIPAGTYRGVDYDVPTYAVTATVITHENVPDEVVYDMVKTVFENLEMLKASHAAFRVLDPQQMLQGLSAPFHPGAVKYYKEKGWM